MGNPIIRHKYTTDPSALAYEDTIYLYILHDEAPVGVERNQPKESILLHLVLPEQEVAPNYTNYLCETNEGRVFSGLIAAEAPGSVTLRQAQGVEETIPRGEIASLTASGTPLMPQELEKGMTAQELADLLAYLKGEAE